MGRSLFTQGIEDTCLNDTTTPINIGLSITADNFSVPEVILNYLSSIKVEREVGENNSATLSFEYSVTHDSLFNSKENVSSFVPPYIAFPSTNIPIKYTVSIEYLNYSDYYIKYIKYNLKNKTQELNAAIDKFNTEIQKLLPKTGDKPEEVSTKQRSIKERTLKLVSEVQNIEAKTLSREERKIEKLKKPENGNSFNLITADTTVLSFSGAKDGMIKYDVTLHEIINSKDTRSEQVQSNSDNSIASTAQNYTTVRELVGIYADRFISNNKNIMLSDFTALLFGMVKHGSDYAVSPRAVTPVNIAIFSQPTPASVSSFKTDSTSATNAKKLSTLLTSANIKLDFSPLEDIDFAEIIGMQRNSTSNLRSKLNFSYKPANGTLKFFDTFREKTLKAKAENAYGEVVGEAQKAVNTAFVNTVNEFFDTSKKLKTDTLNEYLNLIKQNFSIDFKLVTDQLPDEKVNTRIVFFKEGVVYNTAPKPTESEDLKKEQDKFILLDYGGIVLDFRHSVKTASIKVDKVTGGVAVSQRIADMISLDLQLDEKKIKDYAQSKQDMSWISFGKHIIKKANESMDDFLAEFTKYVSNVKVNNIAEPKTDGAGKSKGNQNLTVTLKYPIPITEGQLVFFDVVNGKKYERPGINSYTDENGKTITEPYTEVGFYPIPGKVRGIYIVNKITYDFDARSGVHKMQLECSR